MPAVVSSAIEDTLSPEVWECVREVESGGSKWEKRQDNELRQVCGALEEQQRCLLIFFSTPKQSTPSLPAIHAQLSRDFGISRSFWSALCTETNGYFRCRSPFGAASTSNLVCTEFRFLCKQHITAGHPNGALRYSWTKLVFATYWSSGGSAVLLCFGLSSESRALLCRAMEDLSFEAATNGPFAFHAAVLETVTQIFNDSVWGWRDVVRAIEQQRGDKQTPKADYISMHEIARHTAHSTESLITSLNVVGEIIEASERYDKLVGKQGEVHADLAYNRSLLNCLLERSRALETRLSNEINLVFHMNSQKDSLTAEQIAKAAQRDSTTMKTVAILGLLFLPGTLISAIFSTSFFSYSPANVDGAWLVSGQFWIFWAFTIPITILTLASWFLWQWWQRPEE